MIISPAQRNTVHSSNFIDDILITRHKTTGKPAIFFINAASLPAMIAVCCDADKSQKLLHILPGGLIICQRQQISRKNTSVTPAPNESRLYLASHSISCAYACLKSHQYNQGIKLYLRAGIEAVNNQNRHALSDESKHPASTRTREPGGVVLKTSRALPPNDFSKRATAGGAHRQCRFRCRGTRIAITSGCRTLIYQHRA